MPETSPAQAGCATSRSYKGAVRRRCGTTPAPASPTYHHNTPNTNKMMKIIVTLSALIALCAAKPSVVAAPLLAAPAPLVTATSSQYYHRINNGLAAYVAAPPAYVASAPYVAAAAPYVASPYLASPYVASPYVAAPYSAPIVAV